MLTLPDKIACYHWIDQQNELFCIIFYQNQSYDIIRISSTSSADQTIQLSQRDGKEWKHIAGTMYLQVIMFVIDCKIAVETDSEVIPLLMMLTPSKNPFTLFAVDVFNKIWKVVLNLSSPSTPLTVRLLYAHQQWQIQTILSSSSSSNINTNIDNDNDSTLFISCKKGIIFNLSMNGTILQEMHLPPGRVGHHFIDQTIDIPCRLVIDNEGDVYRLAENGVYREIGGCESLSLPSRLQSSLFYLHDDVLYV